MARQKLEFKLLFVENNQEFMELVAMLMAPIFEEFNQANNIVRIDTNIILASSVQEALRKIVTTPDIRLAIVNLGLPIENGLKLLEDVDSLSLDIGVILESRYLPEATIKEAIELGIYSYFRKPFRPELLAEKILKYIEQKYRKRRVYIEERTIPSQTIDVEYGPYKYLNWYDKEGKKKNISLGKSREAEASIFDEQNNSKQRKQETKKSPQNIGKIISSSAIAEGQENKNIGNKKLELVRLNKCSKLEKELASAK